MPVTMFRSPSCLALLRSDPSRARSPRPRPRLGRRGPSRRPRVSRARARAGWGQGRRCTPRVRGVVARWYQVPRLVGSKYDGSTRGGARIELRAHINILNVNDSSWTWVVEVLEQFYEVIWERSMVPFRAAWDASFLVDPQKI